MDRRNNQRKGAIAHQDQKVHHLKVALTRANDELYSLTIQMSDLEVFKKQSLIEKESFCRSVSEGEAKTSSLEKLLEVTKDRIKHLESLRELKETVTTAESQKSRETIKKQETEISHLKKSLQLQLNNKGAELQKSEEAWQAKYNALEEKFTKNQAKTQNWEKLQIEYKEKVNQVEEQIHQRDTEILDLCMEKEGLSQTLTKTKTLLISKEAELLQTEKDWQEKFNNLEMKTTKDLDQKDQSLETLQVEHQRMMNQVEETIHQRDTTILDLCKEKEGLSQTLTETQNQLSNKEAELLQNEKDWQEKYEALEMKTTEDLDLKEQSLKTLQVEHQNKVNQMEDLIQQRDTEILDLIMTKDSLSEKQTETQNQLISKRAELLQSNEAWQVKYDALEEKTSKDLDLKQQSLDTLQAEYQRKVNQVEKQIHLMDTEILDLIKTKADVSEKLTETQNQLINKEAELLQSEKDWEVKYEALEEKTSKDLDQQVLSWETKVQQLEDEKKVLEDICLQMKKKRRGFFDGAMDRRNNQRKGAIAHQDQKVHHLKVALTRANDELYSLTIQMSDLEVFKKQSLIEKESFCRSVSEGEAKTSSLEKLLEVTKDRIKHLESLRELKETVTTAESQKSRETIKKQETEISHLKKSLQLQLNNKGAELQKSEEAWQAKYNALEEKFTKNQAKTQNWEKLQIEYKEKVNQVEEQIHQRDTEILDLCMEKEGLSQTLTKTKTLLISKEAELLQTEKDWQEKYNNLEMKTTKDLDQKDQSLETLQVEHQRMMNQVEETIHQRDTTILDLCKEKEGLSQTLTETQNQLSNKEAELLQNEKDWQEKYEALEMKTTEDLDLKEQSLKTLQVEHQNKVNQMEDLIQQRETEILDLIKTKDSLSEKQTETQNQLISKRAELLQSNEAWQVKYDALEEKTTKDLDLKQQSLDTLQAEYQRKVNQVEKQIHLMDTEILDLIKTKADVSEKLTETQNQLINKEAELLQSEKDWEVKYEALEEKTSKDLDQQVLSWETKVQQLEDEKKVLEDICLQMKKKRRGFFDGAMDRRNNQRKGAIAHQDQKVHHLKVALTRANDELYSLTIQMSDLEVFKKQSLIEKESFCRSVSEGEAKTSSLEKLLEVTKDRIKHLESLRELKETVTTAESQKSRETIKKQETEISHLKKSLQLQLNNKGAELQKSEEAWQAKYNALEEKFTKNQAKTQNWEKLQIDYKEKVNQVEEQIHQRDTEILDLCMEKEGLSQTLTKTKTLLISKEAELLQTEKDWQEKFNNLEMKTTKDLDQKDQSLETLQVEHQRMMNQVEETIHQRDTTILDLCKEKEGLSQTLTETQNQLSNKEAELLQNEKDWQEKYEALEMKTTEDLDLKEQSLKTLQVEHQDKQTETQNQLISKRAELLQSNEAWQVKYDALEEKTTKDLDLKQQSLDTLQAEYQRKVNQVEKQIHLMDTEILDLIKTKADVSEKLTETQNQLINKEAELLQSEKDWELKYEALEEKTSKDLDQQVLSWETKVQQLEDEKKVLEDICLQMKKKRRGFFGQEFGNFQHELEKKKKKKKRGIINKRGGKMRERSGSKPPGTER
ncbi:golgin subfamily A member 4-like [Anoplopoma fimbria]|uniref:golgin subfamily A member 4-like n=1 Tax=Anoplopoma fimbria TaxID=229290 RepID=UPI0023EB6ADF|nr:golgin subfamily A member 4-like [Anoplopoma fimbria]